MPTNGFFPVYGTLNTSGGQIDPGTNLSQPVTIATANTRISHRFLSWPASSTRPGSSNRTSRFNYNDLLLRQTYIFRLTKAPPPYRGLVYRDGDTKERHHGQPDGGLLEHRIAPEQTLLLGIDLQRHVNEGVGADNYGMGSHRYHEPGLQQLPRFRRVHRHLSEEHQGSERPSRPAPDPLGRSLVADRRGLFDHVETHNISEATSRTRNSNDDNLSLSGSLMYLADNGLSPYFAYAESFEGCCRA